MLQYNGLFGFQEKKNFTILPIFNKKNCKIIFQCFWMTKSFFLFEQQSLSEFILSSLCFVLIETFPWNKFIILVYLSIEVDEKNKLLYKQESSIKIYFENFGRKLVWIKSTKKYLIITFCSNKRMAIFVNIIITTHELLSRFFSLP